MFAITRVGKAKLSLQIHTHIETATGEASWSLRVSVSSSSIFVSMTHKSLNLKMSPQPWGSDRISSQKCRNRTHPASSLIMKTAFLKMV